MGKTTKTINMTLPTINEQHAQPPFRRRLLSTKMADACLDWVIFPSLLFIQFGVTLGAQHQEQQQKGLLPDPSFAVCFLNVALFCATAGIYRQVVRRHPTQSVFVLLLPEVLTNILLAWVMIGSLNEAFTLLLWSTGLLLLIGGVTQSHAMFIRRRRHGSANPNHYQLLVDKATSEDGDDEEYDDGSDNEWVC
jgi:hypothetical protein